jgi:release factor glutamine methyltransferase
MVLSLKEFLWEITQQLRPSSESASLDAQVLVADQLGRSRSWVMAHPEELITEDQYQRISQCVERLVNGEPLPYVMGHWEFFGRDFVLTPDVLIPRPETELLVEQSIKWLNDHPGQRKALDVGTGSGCIAISLAASIPVLTITATDISPRALEITLLNAQNHHVAGRLELIQADLLDGLPGRFDLICANLPYIPSAQLKSLAVAKREPITALDGGTDGMDLIRKLLSQARQKLLPGGAMLLEIEASQGDQVCQLSADIYPSSRLCMLKDLAGHDRCVMIERSNYLVHICPRHEWQQALEQGSFTDASLERDGFIHCSTPEQVLEVANRFYSAQTGLLLLWLEPASLSAEIRWEAADNDLFPHIYGPINLEAVVSISSLICDEDGVFRKLELPG